MGKIILTERQYRNLNQILIGKESDSKKGRINEVAKTFTDFDGNSAILDSTKFTLSLKGTVSAEALTSEDSNRELQLLPGTVFTKKQGDNILKSNSVKINYVSDSWGSIMKSETGTVEYKCDSKKFRFTKYSNEYKFDAGDYTWIHKAFDELCAMTGVAPVVAPVVAAAKIFPWGAPEQKDILAFQQWWWRVAEDDLTAEPGTDYNDRCKAKYRSALCGGKPCIQTQAIDGKLGPSTIQLMNIYDNRPIFEKWWNTGTNAADYGTLPKTCTSVEKGYVNPDKNPDKNPVKDPVKNPVVGGGGGGAPFGGQYVDMV